MDTTNQTNLNGSSLLDLSVAEVGSGLDKKLFTIAELTAAYLSRIEEASDFHAVLETNPDAKSIAESLDKELANGTRRGPLHGVPILVKDNIVTNDKMEATAGSYALLGAKPAQESSLITKLRKAGAVILGKANLSEWAYVRDSSIIQTWESGWSPRGGQTVGAYYPNSRSDGSSSGSAVGAALGLCVAALGSETSGSILDPAEVNNVVGFKPSRGLIGSDGAIPISKRQDVIGILGHSVSDAASFLTVMAGRSKLDPGTWNIPFDTIPDFSEYTTKTDLKDLVIGVPRNTFSGDSSNAALRSFEHVLKVLETAGTKIIDQANPDEVDEYLKFKSDHLGYCVSSEFKHDIQEYFEGLETNPNNLKTLDDLIKFTEVNESEDYPNHGMDGFLWARDNAPDVSSDEYKAAAKKELYYGGNLIKVFEKSNVDVLAVPSTMSFVNDLAAKVGMPIIAVPLGFWPEGTAVEYDRRPPNLVKRAPGIPYCITFLAKPFDDGKVLQVAHVFEQLTQVRRRGPKPFKSPTTELRIGESKV